MIPQLQREAPVSAQEDASSWSLASRIAFRFGFSYFILYVYPRSVGSLGAGIKYNNPLRDMWHVVVPWVGEHVLHLPGPFTEIANGSGDQMYDYVLLFCIAIVAAVATIVWSWLDRNRKNYRVLYEWLRLFVRIVVAVAMISYGANKLFRMQFPEPGLAKFVDTYGQSSPMGLLWAFMGTSRAYSFFGGVGEMLGGLLLLVPRFTKLGSASHAGRHEQRAHAQLLLRRAAEDLLHSPDCVLSVPAGTRHEAADGLVYLQPQSATHPTHAAVQGQAAELCSLGFAVGNRCRCSRGVW